MYCRLHVHGVILILDYHGRIQRGGVQGYGPAPSTDKSQVATGFLRNTGTDPLGSTASRGRFVRPSVNCVDGLKLLGPHPYPDKMFIIYSGIYSHCTSSSNHGNGKPNTKTNNKRLAFNV